MTSSPDEDWIASLLWSRIIFKQSHSEARLASLQGRLAVQTQMLGLVKKEEIGNTAVKIQDILDEMEKCYNFG